MGNRNYTIYHLHSDLSNGVTNIDSVTKYYEYINRAQELGMKALGFGEHGCVLEWVHKKNKIEAAGMKYIHAEEFYVTEKLFHNPEITDEIYEKLLSRSIAVRFMGGYLRITAGTKEEHKALFSALEEIAKELSSL